MADESTRPFILVAAVRRNDHCNAAAYGWTDTRSGCGPGPFTGVHTTFCTARFTCAAIGSCEHDDNIHNNEAGVLGTG